MTQHVWHPGQEFLSSDDRDITTIIITACELPPNYWMWCVLYEAVPDLL